MSEEINDYLSGTWSRDKVMAIVQFLPMALAGPVDAMGNPAFARSLSNLSRMADSYRAVTRLSLLFGALSRPALDRLRNAKGDEVISRLDQVSHFFHVLFCLFENHAVLACHGVIPSRLSRLGGCAVTCWFYVLLTNLMRELYIFTKNEPSEEEKRHHFMSIVKFTCFLIFAMSSVPKGGPQLLEDGTGILSPLHSALRMIVPPHISLSNSTRGLLGLIASICDFY